MTNSQLGEVLLAVLLLLLAANLLGQLFRRLRQPKVVGEILAGILLGPTVFGKIAPGFTADLFGADKADHRAVVLGFLYNLGLLMLMFVSGCAAQHLLGEQNRKATAWILGVGTPLPFVIALLAAPLLPLDEFTGVAGSKEAVVLVFAAATAVTSIPVITKIFYDLGILHTRFASLQLGSAVLEDIALWGVLSVATAIAAATIDTTGDELAATIGTHVAVNLGYVIIALTVMPAVLRRLSRAEWNVVARNSPVAWMLIVFLGYVSLAAALDVTLAFAGLLAGFGVMGGMKGTEQERFRAPMQSIGDVAGHFFVPLYFAIVGYRLDLSKTFDPLMLAGFLIGTSLVVFLSVGLGAKLAGMSRLDIVNIAVTRNARGGPGIVMASVAFDAGIINATFYTALVLTAVLTSQACGFWLDYVLRKGWPLLSGADLRRRGIEPVPEELPSIR
ncbi:transporter (CPA2 family) [Nocardia tenerifensis]|uniref:Transporter (CPA2 family) n=1 Tax=Nocardia tenerifensis TaxID=228006 RepID=A0A318KAF4_9NOCA|nr:cation:proton antiporter [Nocardia tenerifensis]PXX71308.1 transporter (CPA2 family) [Nocardia tenerifensis]